MVMSSVDLRNADIPGSSTIRRTGSIEATITDSATHGPFRKAQVVPA
jgi:hypothetical protein